MPMRSRKAPKIGRGRDELLARPTISNCPTAHFTCCNRGKMTPLRKNGRRHLKPTTATRLAVLFCSRKLSVKSGNAKSSTLRIWHAQKTSKQARQGHHVWVGLACTHVNLGVVSMARRCVGAWDLRAVHSPHTRMRRARHGRSDLRPCVHGATRFSSFINIPPQTSLCVKEGPHVASHIA